jgi:hypothetical protein
MDKGIKDPYIKVFHLVTVGEGKSTWTTFPTASQAVAAKEVCDALLTGVGLKTLVCEGWERNKNF